MVVFALLRIGAIPVMALPGHRKVELTHLCAHSQAVALVVADQDKGFDHRELAREVLTEGPHTKHVVVAGDAEEFIALSELRLPGCDLRCRPQRARAVPAVRWYDRPAQADPADP